MSGVDWAAIQIAYQVVKDLLGKISEMPVSIPDKKAFAKELYEACRQWADNLHKMLEVAANRLVKNDVEGALTEVQRLQDDELAIDYTILDNSPILTELKNDIKFQSFAELHQDFLDFSLRLKSHFYAGIDDGQGNFVYPNGGGLEKFVEELKKGINVRIKNLGEEHNRIRVIRP